MFKFRLPPGVRSKRVTWIRFPLRLDGKHFAGVIKYGSRRLDFGPGPSSVAERAERWRSFSCANVAGDQISLLEWNIELRFVCELERENFLLLFLVGTDRRAVRDLKRRLARRPRPTNFHQSEESADAMLEMHHEVALIELTEINLCAIAFRTT